ncbi:MAG: hypothetical protein ACRYG7_05570 [Janthinobacterium lividum]
MKLPPRKEAAALQAIIDQGATAPTEKPAVDTQAISSYTLRLYTTKLQQLTDARDARRIRHRAKSLPNASAISVHALILEGIDLLLKQEAKLAAKESAKQSTIK